MSREQSSTISRDPFDCVPCRSCGFDIGTSTLDCPHCHVSQCVCSPDGCDEEGEPGCSYCRRIDGEWPCPADVETLSELAAEYHPEVFDD